MILPFLVAWLATQIYCHQGHATAYLREENRILKAKLKGNRIQLTDIEHRRLAVLAHPIERKYLKELSTIACMAFPCTPTPIFPLIDAEGVLTPLVTGDYDGGDLDLEVIVPELPIRVVGDKTAVGRPVENLLAIV